MSNPQFDFAIASSEKLPLYEHGPSKLGTQSSLSHVTLRTVDTVSIMQNGRPFYSSIYRTVRTRALPTPWPTLCYERSGSSERRHHGRMAQPYEPPMLPCTSGVSYKPYMPYPRPRQQFSTTSPAAHGHITTPKPGEECAIPPSHHKVESDLLTTGSMSPSSTKKAQNTTSKSQPATT